MKPVTIIGGGLAGLTLGVYLRRKGIETTLYEAGKYPKHKVCGEFISGVSRDVLEEIGAENIISDSNHHQKVSWWIEGSLVMDEILPKVAWGLSRYKLDEDLADRFVKTGGKLILGQRVKEEEFDEPGTVLGVGKYKKPSKSKNNLRWIGLKIHAVDVPAAEIEGLEMHLGKSGYIGFCRVEGNRVNCCGLFQVDTFIRGSSADLILNYLKSNGLADLAKRLKSWQFDAFSFSATSGFALGSQEKRGGFCIGDASYLIPPFTGNGMSMAIESSHIAGSWLERYAREQVSWHETCLGYDKQCAAHFKKRMGLSTQLHPFLFNKASRLLLKVSAKSGVLPFQLLFNQLRTP